MPKKSTVSKSKQAKSSTGTKQRTAQTAYQLKITLKGCKPSIWRRIQVEDCTLHKLHEHIQTAMGWTNSHLHHFFVGKQPYGNPELMQENFEDMGYEDSTGTMLSQIVPTGGKRFKFSYEYDFGDSWEHEIVVEKAFEPEPGKTYPVCLEGERACPPEDCGGIWGYADLVEAMNDKQHARRDELLEWLGEPFNAEAFDPVEATHLMVQGPPGFW